MDAKQLGNFIQSIRKEKGLTQAQLGEQINVTDKAISRWERGIGFPDINLLEPLAQALDITVLELIQSQKLEKESISKNEAADMMTNALSLAQEQTRILCRARLLKFGLLPIVTVVELFLFVMVSFYVTKPFWLRILTLAVVACSGSFISWGIRYIADCGYLKAPKSPMYYLTLMLSFIGILMVGFGWLLNTGKPLLYVIVTTIGLALIPTNLIYQTMRES